MDKESWLIIMLLIIVESTMLHVYLPHEILAYIFSIMIAAIIVSSAYKIEKYVNINNGSSTV